MTIVHRGVYAATHSHRTWRRFGILLTLVLASMLMTAGAASAETLTVTASSPPSGAYGDPVPTVTPSYDGFVPPDGPELLDIPPTCSVPTYEPGDPPGDYPTSCSGGSDDRYAFSFVAGNFHVDKKTLTVTADDKSKAYGDSNPALTVTYTGFLYGQTASVLTTAPTCTTTAVQYSSVALSPYPITCSGGTAANYTLTYVPGSLAVTRATLTVTAVDKWRVYGSANPALTFTYSGFKGYETASVLTRAPSCRTTAGQHSHVGSYPITCSGGMDDNYAFAYVPGTLTITSVLPGAPLAPRGSPGSGTVRVSWLAPSSGGGAGISDYLIQYRRKGATTWILFSDGFSADLHAHVTGLSNGVLYQFRVAAHNSAGVGPWSAATEMRAGVPTRPLTVAPSPASRQVQLSRQAPISDGGAAVSHYSIQYRRKGTTAWVTFPDGISAALHAHVTGLTNGVVYQFRVAAVNARGVGMWSMVVDARPRA